MTTYFNEVLAKVDKKTVQTVLQRLEMGDLAFVPSQMKFAKGRMHFP